MDRSDRLERLEAMLLIRRFEERLVRLHEARAFRGHFHVSIGQESGAVATCRRLRPDDYLFTTHRNHAHLLARGADPARIFAEILGRAGGYNGGRGGTLHVAAPELNVPVTSALVGGSIPISVGTALGALAPAGQRRSSSRCSATRHWRRARSMSRSTLPCSGRSRSCSCATTTASPTRSASRASTRRLG